MTTIAEIRNAQEINERAKEHFEPGLPVVQKRPTFSLAGWQPANVKEAIEYARFIADADALPKEFRSKPANILIALQLGAEVGLSAATSLQSIAVINGRPTLYGDALWGLILSHPQCEWTDEQYDAATHVATCSIKRRNRKVVVRAFSKQDAERARLWQKDGPWSQYQERMLRMRARGFAARDSFADALKGLRVAEDANIAERDIGTAELLSETPANAVEPPTMTIEPPSFAADRETGEILAPAPAPITDGALRIITKKLEERNLTDRFYEAFKVSEIKRLPMSEVQSVIDWIGKQE